MVPYTYKYMVCGNHILYHMSSLFAVLDAAFTCWMALKPLSPLEHRVPEWPSRSSVCSSPYFVVNRNSSPFLHLPLEKCTTNCVSSSCLVCLCHAAVAFTPLPGEHTRTAAPRAILSSLRLTDSRQTPYRYFPCPLATGSPLPYTPIISSGTSFSKGVVDGNLW